MSDHLKKVSIPVYYENYANVPVNEITGAFADAQKLYGPITLQAAPWNASGAIPQSPYLDVVFTNKVLPGVEQGVSGAGLQQAKRAYVYPNSLQTYPDPTRALGFVLAHELGHLLGLQHTPAGGLMQPAVTPDTLGYGMIGLSNRQLRQAERTLSAMYADSAPRRILPLSALARGNQP